VFYSLVLVVRYASMFLLLYLVAVFQARMSHMASSCISELMLVTMGFLFYMYMDIFLLSCRCVNNAVSGKE